MNDIKTVLIVLQFVVIAVLTYFVISGSGQENTISSSKKPLKYELKYYPTECSTALMLANNYKHFINNNCNGVKPDKEGAIFEIKKNFLQAVINDSQLDYIVGVIGRDNIKESNTLIMMAVDNKGKRRDVLYPGNTAPLPRVDEMYPSITKISSDTCYNVFNCPNK